MTLLAAYNFDEASGAIVDVTGNGHGFALDASVTRQTGHTNTGLRHETTAVDSAGPAIFGQTAQRTLMAWVKRTSNSVDGWILEMKNGTAATGVWGFLYSSGNLQARAKNSSNVATFASVAQPTVNVWHHLAMTYDGTTIALFIDGSQVATAAFTGPIWTSATAFPFMDNAGPETVIDDVRVYDTALDAATISSLMATPVSGGATLTLNLATETDTARALGLAKTSGLPSAAETDTARQLVVAKTAQLGAAGETATARQFTLAKTLATQATTENDQARQVNLSKALALASPAETGAAHALAFSKAVQLGRATETDAAVALLLGGGGLVLGVAGETDATWPMGWGKNLVLSRALEIDASHQWSAGATTPYDPVTDPISTVRPNLATAMPRDNAATAVIRANPAEAAP